MEEVIGRENPLQNPLVLKIIFNQLGTKDRKSFRKVDKTWNLATLDRWRKTAPLTLKSCPQYFHPKTVSFLQLLSEKEDFYNLKEKPFRNYHLDEDFFLPFSLSTEDNLDAPRLPELCKSFWKICGASMTCLEWTSLKVSNIPAFLKFFNWIITSCPNLSSVFLEFNAHDCPNWFLEEKDLPLQSHDTFSSNLTRLTLKQTCFTRHNMERGCYFLYSLSVPIQKLIPNLKSLHLTDHAMIFLRGLKFPGENTAKNYVKLEEISLSYHWITQASQYCYDYLIGYLESFPQREPCPLRAFKVDTCLDFIRKSQIRTFRDFLSLAGVTLTKLELHLEQVTNSRFIPWFDLTGIEFPCLTHLTLKFKEAKHYFKPTVKVDFRFLKGMPKLKQLRVTSDLSFKWKVLDVQKTVFTPQKGKDFLEELIDLPDLVEFGFCLGYIPKVKDLQKIGEWAKNLKTVEIIPDNQILYEVFKIWPDIRNLTLLSDKFIDKSVLHDLVSKRSVNVIVHSTPENYYEQL